MNSAQRTTIPVARATAALVATAGMLCAMSASAEPAEDTQGAAPNTTTAMPAPAAGTAGAPPATPRPLALPPPGPVYPAGYPFTAQPRPRPVEPGGPVWSWDPLRFAIAIETQTRWLVHDSAKRIAGHERPVAVGVSLQADVVRPRPDLAVRLDLAWVPSSETS